MQNLQSKHHQPNLSITIVIGLCGFIMLGYTAHLENLCPHHTPGQKVSYMIKCQERGHQKRKYANRLRFTNENLQYVLPPSYIDLRKSVPIFFKILKPVPPTHLNFILLSYSNFYVHLTARGDQFIL